MQAPTITSAKEMKKTVEKGITDMLRKFSDATKLSIESINIVTGNSDNDVKHVIRVELNVKL